MHFTLFNFLKNCMKISPTLMKNLLFACFVLAAFLKDRGPWIVKPCASSRGRGIYLVNHVCIIIHYYYPIFDTHKTPISLRGWDRA